MIANETLKRIVQLNFSTCQISYVFAYGSGALPQLNNKPKMLDMIFVVKNAERFHSENLKLNPSHYSSVCRQYGIQYTNFIHSIEPNVYFNHSIPVANGVGTQLIKYGVICDYDLQSQFKHYKNLFLLGRCHKPILGINFEEDNSISNLIRENKKIGFALAVLMSRSATDIEEVLLNLISLSLIGDIRFYLKGEKSSKSMDMLQGSFKYFKDEFDQFFEFFRCAGNSVETRKLALSMIPQSMIANLHLASNLRSVSLDTFMVMLPRMSHESISNLIKIFLHSSNLKVSSKALAVAAITTDLRKGFYYILRKLSKGILGR